MAKRFKILTSAQDIAGTIDNQKLAVSKCAADLENQINAESVDVVLSVSAYESDHEFYLIAAVEVSDKKEDAPLPPEGQGE